jgi:hypothetical protein
VTEDPVKLDLVASFPRPAGNATGLYIFVVELGAKRLGLLHELIPAAGRIAVLTNPATIDAEPAARTMLDAARTIGLQARVINASTSGEIDAAFEALALDRPDAFTAVANPLFTSRRMQIVLKVTHLSLPAIYSNRDFVEAGGLMSTRQALRRSIANWASIPGVQGDDACGPAGGAADEVRACPQPAGGQDDRRRCAGYLARPGGRGHRVSSRRDFMTLLGGAVAA